MKKKDRGRPEIVFIGPPQCREKHKLMVFKIHARDANGVPTLIEMLKDDEIITVEEGLQFMTGYVLDEMTKRCSERANYNSDVYTYTTPDDPENLP